MFQSLDTFTNTVKLGAFILVALFAFTNSFAQGEVSVSRGASSTQASAATETVHELAGKASFYGDEYQGRKAANGEIFDNAQFTAAHKTLPFGTMIKVTRNDNGKSVEVRIIDRGPFKPGRVVDLSQTAAVSIGLVRDGVADVTVAIISTPQTNVLATTNPENGAKPVQTAISLENKNIKVISAPQDDYGIQVGAFSDVKAAERATQNLGQKGINNLVIHTGTSSSNAVVFRVIVGPFEQKEEAQKVYETLAGIETAGLVIDMNNLR